jgi:hypothetical protein
MNYDSKTDDELLRGVLYRADDATLTEDSDEADELMALFMDGAMDGDDRAAFFQYLDTHPQARRAAALGAWHMDLHRGVVPTRPAASDAAHKYGRFALAAVGERFRQALIGALPDRFRQSTARAAAHGIAFGYRRQLAFATVGMLLVATTAALWIAWRPSQTQLLALRGGFSPIDFGASPDLENAIAIKGADAAGESLNIQALLEDVPNSTERAHLSQAYTLLKNNQLTRAREEFARVIDENPQSYYAWLGQGTAYHLMQRAEDFQQAAISFHKASELRHQSDAAHIGLAMTLSRLGQDTEALAEWRHVELKRLPKWQREAAAREISRLSQKR